ncbi:MAG: amidohydrolase [Thermomicrobium sp.]|nr:amidohydrolase [Thermomicrobium sp.]MCS7246272.1 amidohydrolase [Thermomicrobium sp.]MDW7982273.1 amidohydrolase family protein [Thermomicrobium sp.]
MTVIDAHVHIFPTEVVAQRDHFCRLDPWFDALYRNPRARLVTAEELLASMDDAGIQTAVAAGFPWADPALCRYHNEYLAEVARRSAGRIAWLATVVPHHPQAAVETERWFALGAAGVGELNADAQGFRWDEPERLQDLVSVCQHARRPLMAHVSEPLGHWYPGKGMAWPQRFVRFLERFPDLTVVAAHWGGGLPFYELMPEIAAAARNVVYDSAASTYLYRFQVFRIVSDLVGPDRVLFGSDYPVLRQRRFLERVRAEADLSASELVAVLGGNAARVYGLPFPMGEGRPQ